MLGILLKIYGILKTLCLSSNMYPVNILLTNFCNQNCSFCFAAQEMANKRIDREMKLADFKKAVLKIKKQQNLSVKLLGGEPTLHSQFKQIITYAHRHLDHIQIFTNGIIGQGLIDFLLTKTPKVAFTFNVMTPGFLLKPNLRQLITRNIHQLAQKTQITLSFTFDMNTNMQQVMQTIGPETLAVIHGFRLGFANPTKGETNYYQFSHFPKMGSQLEKIILAIRKHNQNSEISLNCGFTRCMFTNQQYALFKKEVVSRGFGCFGKESAFDLQTDMTAFHCFPLSSLDKINSLHRSFNSVENTLLKQRFKYWSKIRQEVCVKCPFYGFGKEQCPGPCLAFLMNNQTAKN